MVQQAAPKVEADEPAPSGRAKPSSTQQPKRHVTGRYSAYVPIVLTAVGFILIGIAWNGAAGVDYPQGQIPYMISGGLIGLGFIFLGSTGSIVQAIKKSQVRQQAELRDLVQTLHRVASAQLLTPGSNGHGPSDPAMVVAGASSFHRPDCRMVGEREGSSKVSREEAISEGLEPCRICSP